MAPQSCAGLGDIPVIVLGGDVNSMRDSVPRAVIKNPSMRNFSSCALNCGFSYYKCRRGRTHLCYDLSGAFDSHSVHVY